MTYDGMYVPALNTPLDLNQDGQPDVAFVRSAPGKKVPGVYYFQLDDNYFKHSEGNNVSSY